VFDKETQEDAKKEVAKWKERVDQVYKGDEYNSTTYSEIPIKSVYTPLDIEDTEYNRIGMPGLYPYTRGMYPAMYQRQPWNFSQALGLASIEESRARYEKLCREGLRGYEGRNPNCFFSTDMANMQGYDADDPLAQGWVGMTGPSINSIPEFEALYEGIDLEKTNILLSLFDTSPIGLAMLVTLAEKRGIPKEKLHGQTINYFYRQMYMEHPSFPPEAGLKINREYVKYCIENVPYFVPVNFSCYDVIESGGDSIQELAFILSVAIALTEECKASGLDPDDFVTKFNFHMSGHMDFFETVCKIRAVRRMWAKITSERFGCKKPRSMALLTDVKTCGATYTAQQPLNNVIRGAYETLAAVMGGVNSIWTTHYDDALANPTEQAATLGLRTQQIILHEMGVHKVTDPLAGSYYVEWLTNRIEEDAWKLLDKTEEMGGYVECMKTAWFRHDIDRVGISHKRKQETGEEVMVGMNKFTQEEEYEVPVQEYEDTTEEVVARLKKYKAGRDQSKLEAALAELKAACEGVEAGGIGVLMPAILNAVKADATVGEIMTVEKEVFGWGLID